MTSSPIARAAVVAALTALSTSAHAQAAQTVAFFDRASFEAALVGRTDLSFAGLVGPGGSASYSDASPLVLGPLTIGGPGFTVLDRLADDRGRAATVTPGNGGTNRITLHFATPITAFGADYLPNVATTDHRWTLTAPELGSATVHTNLTGWQFFGITSDTPFSSAFITSEAPVYYDRPTLGEVGSEAEQFGYAFTMPAEFSLIATPVPEPSTVVLTAAGLIGLAVGAWRRRRAAAG